MPNESFPAETARMLEDAAKIIAGADALLIAAGAGMGVDSGLPDFRGVQGFWKAYPPFAKLGLRFEELANPTWFERDPELAWGFYGHRSNLYRATEPHPGFALLKKWSDSKPLGAFVFTSNIDGHFQRAGFDENRVMECHGTLAYWQCSTPCARALWPAATDEIPIDESTMRARPPLPRCPRCGRTTRPNVLMFGDYDWIEERTEAQEQRLGQWLSQATKKKLAIIECGAGKAVPTVRRTCEGLAHQFGARLIRINVREPEVPHGHLGVQLPALAALERIDLIIASNA